MSQRIHVVMPDELVQAIDAVRGDVSRSRWILRATKDRLGVDQDIGQRLADEYAAETPAERPKKRKAAQDPPEGLESPQDASQKPTGPYRQGYGPDVTRYRSTQQVQHKANCTCPVCTGAVKG